MDGEIVTILKDIVPGFRWNLLPLGTLTRRARTGK